MKAEEGRGLADQDRRYPSEIAAEIFEDASMKCPASVIAQSAWVAYRCKEEGHDPNALGDWLKVNVLQIRNLSQKARDQHSKRGIGPMSMDKLMEKMPGIVESDFNGAAILIELDADFLLDVVTTMYLGRPKKDPEWAFGQRVAEAIPSEAVKTKFAEFALKLKPII